MSSSSASADFEDYFNSLSMDDEISPINTPPVTTSPITSPLKSSPVEMSLMKNPEQRIEPIEPIDPKESKVSLKGRLKQDCGIDLATGEPIPSTSRAKIFYDPAFDAASSTSVSSTPLEADALKCKLQKIVQDEKCGGDARRIVSFKDPSPMDPPERDVNFSTPLRAAPPQLPVPRPAQQCLKRKRNLDTLDKSAKHAMDESTFLFYSVFEKHGIKFDLNMSPQQMLNMLVETENLPALHEIAKIPGTPDDLKLSILSIMLHSTIKYHSAMMFLVALMRDLIADLNTKHELAEDIFTNLTASNHLGETVSENMNILCDDLKRLTTKLHTFDLDDERKQ